MLQRIFMGGSQRCLMRDGVAIYVYHYLGAPAQGSPDPYLYVSRDGFRKQCATLRRHGYSTTSLSDVAAACREGKLLPGEVVITIDDGARNFFEHGMEILAAHGFHAIQFLVAGRIGGINDWDAKHGHPVVPLMDETQVREWLAAGHDIGSHSMTHRNLSKLDEAAARQQIFDSKHLLEDKFGVAVRHFCYPHGKSTAMIESLVQEAGYETACTTRFGINRPGGNPMACKRIFPLSCAGLSGKVLHRLADRAKIRRLLRRP